MSSNASATCHSAESITARPSSSRSSWSMWSSGSPGSTSRARPPGSSATTGTRRALGAHHAVAEPLEDDVQRAVERVGVADQRLGDAVEREDHGAPVGAAARRSTSRRARRRPARGARARRSVASRTLAARARRSAGTAARPRGSSRCRRPCCRARGGCAGGRRRSVPEPWRRDTYPASMSPSDGLAHGRAAHGVALGERLLVGQLRAALEPVELRQELRADLLHE